MNVTPGKIRPPLPRGGPLFARPALEARLRDALQAHRAVLLAAPAGCGKTALLVRALVPPPPGQGLAWVSLDPGDDLHRLLSCLIAALEPFDPPWRVAPEGLVVAALQGEARGRQQAVDEIAFALDACELAHGVVVVDDLHHLADEAALQLLARLVERLPARWTLVLASRETPPLLARVAVAGELARFGQDELLFSADEVQAWLLSLGLDAETAQALHRRTAGWAAGLRLALGGARGGGPAGAIDRAAFDFLATEVLAHLDPPLRDFLLATRLLVELDAARGEALTGDLRAARWIDEIERRGLFASVVDEAGPTLRLHDLFRDALQHRLRVERPEDLPRLQQRAAALETDPLRRQGLLLAARRPDEAARALLAVAPELNTGGAAPAVLRMLQAYAPAFAAGSPEWQRAAGLASMTVWRQTDAERHFAAAEALYRARGEADAAQAMAARRATTLVALGRIAEATAQLQALQEAPLAEVEARLNASTAAAWLALESGDHDAVAAPFAAFVQQQLQCQALTDWGNVPPPRLTACRGVAPLVQRWAEGALAVVGDRPLPLRTFALLALGWRALWQGRIAESRRHLADAMGDASWGGHEIIARSHALALDAMLALLRGERARALQTVRQRVAEQPAGYRGWGLWHAQLYAARVAAAAGERGELQAWLHDLEALQHDLTDRTPRRLRPLQALQAVRAQLDGDAATARRLGREALADEVGTDLFGQAGELRVRLAALDLADGAHDDAAAGLRPLLQRAEDGPRGALFAPDALATLAGADWSGRLADDEAATLRTWAAAVVAARPGAAAAAASAAWPAATAAQVATAGGEGFDADDGGAGTPTGERLTGRELEVVALIARGQSNKLIARALDLSPHTVKRHVANALGKLGMVSRGQAAAWFHARPR